MTAKEYLRQYINADRIINTKLDQISQLKQLATKSTTVLSDSKVSGCMSNDKIADIIAKIVDMEHQVDEEIDALQDIKDNVINAINSIDNEKLREILEMRYINNMKWEEIAVKANYDYRHVTKLHGQALQLIRCP